MFTYYKGNEFTESRVMIINLSFECCQPDKLIYIFTLDKLYLIVKVDFNF